MRFVARGLFILLLSSQAHAQLAISAGARNSLATRIEAPQPTPRKRSQFKWKLGLDGTSMSDGKDQAQKAGFGARADLRFKLLESLEIKALGGLRHEVGHTQSRFGDNDSKSGLDVVEAYMQFQPIKEFAIQAGAINQEHLDSPLLFSERAFPAAVEKVKIGNLEYEAEVKAQQAIPTSRTLSTKTVESEPTPSFTSETLTLKARPMRGPVLLKAFGTHFAFRGLPSSVASESQGFGNTVIDPGVNSAKFKFEFDGWIAGGKLKWNIDKGFAWNLEGHMIQNTRAPETYRNGQMVGTSFEIPLPKDIDLEPKAYMFFAESDVVPAYYSSSDLGRNNRQGWGAKLSATVKPAGFKVAANYVDAAVINSGPLQNRQQYFMLQLETLYEDL